MTEKRSNEPYIKCSRCKSKYINDGEHIKRDFGYTRLEERYKTCAKCRNKDKQRVEQLKRDAEMNSDTIKHCYRCYKNKPFDEFVCPNGKTYGACYGCLKNRYG